MSAVQRAVQEALQRAVNPDSHRAERGQFLRDTLRSKARFRHEPRALADGLGSLICGGSRARTGTRLLVNKWKRGVGLESVRVGACGHVTDQSAQFFFSSKARNSGSVYRERIECATANSVQPLFGTHKTPVETYRILNQRTCIQRFWDCRLVLQATHR